MSSGEEAVTGTAYAKINLTLAVGPTREDGLHELVTVMERVDLADTIRLTPADAIEVEGFADDTLVRRALEAVAAAHGGEAAWRAQIEKRIPVAGGLGGGSSDAATALRLAATLVEPPLTPEQLHELARPLGADVPFFLESGPQLATGDGRELEAVELPRDYTVLLLLPHGAVKPSTAEIYAQFAGADGFDERRALILETIAAGSSADLSALPPNDLARSPLSAELLALGAFRADVSGAGPTLYALFDDPAVAAAAARRLAPRGRTWLARPAWYG